MRSPLSPVIRRGQPAAGHPDLGAWAGRGRRADRVQRDFTATAPDQLRVADITYVPTWEGFLYLAVVLDAFSRRIVGWAMAPHLKTALVLAALEMARVQRRPTNVIHHSDHGSQYTSLGFRARCETLGVRPSRGTVGDCYDKGLVSYCTSCAV